MIFGTLQHCFVLNKDEPSNIVAYFFGLPVGYKITVLVAKYVKSIFRDRDKSSHRLRSTVDDLPRAVQCLYKSPIR